MNRRCKPGHAGSNPQTIRTGFTMVEMVAAIAIMGIIAAGIAVFLRMPLQAYQDTERRAAISDTTNTVFTYMKRDLQNALPNSVRLTSDGNVVYLEFLAVRTAGRYRSTPPTPAAAWDANNCPDTNVDGYADENVLEFGVADTCLTSLGALPHLDAVVNSDFVVVYNLGTGFTGGDAYASGAVTGGNKAKITAVATGANGENVIRFQSNTFPLDSPAHRFQIVSGPVTYVCDPDAGTFTRISGYAISAAQPKAPAGTSALLAKGITACTITYDQNVIDQRMGLVSVWLTFSDPNATALNLFQQIQATNVP